MGAMPARIEFDYERAVERATQLFWKKGYRNASLRELLRMMGIGEGSFYNTFRSKRRLYLECLQHYNDTVSRRRVDAMLKPPSAAEGVRAFFKRVLDEIDDPRTPSVCMLAGSVSADVMAEREVSRAVLKDMNAFAGAFRQRLASAREIGELPGNFDADLAAGVIMTFVMGMFRVIRVVQTRAETERQIEALLRGLGI